MRDQDLYATVLGIRAPWCLESVEFEEEAEEVRLLIRLDAREGL